MAEKMEILKLIFFTKIHFPNHPFPYEHCVILQSAPFGLISNTSQEEDVFARVFIEDLKSWRSSSTTVMDNLTPPPSTTDLTIEELVDSIEHYFIHKTGIRPTDWVMPYIDNVLRNAYRKYRSSFRISCRSRTLNCMFVFSQPIRFNRKSLSCKYHYMFYSVR